ncbi:hypothetical protein [Sphingobacterium paramultivorum]|uniref:hypothetical protein n=1 Tax=Sphingobacterium paramultivorum TaxID=2886510 RepID=UPI00129CD1C7|nr:hypothetical protein [Sphingobacterium paramultivorum]
MLYNPFEPVTKDLFNELVESGYDYFVLQRLNWPGIKENTGFLLTPYDEQKQAEEHAFHLGAKEGKSVRIPDDIEKIDSLLLVGSGYRIFLNRIKDENWESRMKKFYEKNIINYLRTKTRFKRTDHIDIYFRLEHGRVIAEITNGETKKNVPAIDLLL